MYCSKCGNKVNENDKFCTKCGNACIEQERTFNNENINQFNTSNSTNSMALPSLICSIVGLFVFGIPLGIISLILGIMAHKQAVISRSSTKMATWAIILGIIDIVLPIIYIDSWYSLIF